MNTDLLGPQLYVQHNKAQRHSVQQLLDEYIHLVRWKPDADDSVMEVGCGPGDITTEILLPKLPKSLRELVATDLSPQMIQYARNHHQHPLVSYDILDISTKTLPGMYHGRFDHVFSFYCLHWVQDQRQAMRNIFDMLKPGGDVLFILFVRASITKLISKLSSQNRWKPHIKGPVVEPVYQHEQNVEEVLHDLLQAVGFQSIICQKKSLQFTYGNTHAYVEEVVAAISFVQKMPPDLRAKFVEECIVKLKDQECPDDGVNDGVLSHVSILINARKPKL